MNSFRVCGISVAVDGTEDGKINYLWEGGMAADVLATITTETTLMASSSSSMEPDDPFTDEDETDENVAVMYDC